MVTLVPLDISSYRQFPLPVHCVDFRKRQWLDNDMRRKCIHNINGRVGLAVPNCQATSTRRSHLPLIIASGLFSLHQKSKLTRVTVRVGRGLAIYRTLIVNCGRPTRSVGILVRQAAPLSGDCQYYFWFSLQWHVLITRKRWDMG